MRIVLQIILLIISISFGRSQSTIADIPRFSIEQTNGYSFLTDAKVHPYINYPYYMNQVPVAVDHYNFSFVNTGLVIGCNLNERKDIFDDPYFFTIGIGFSEWMYTLQRTYQNYNYYSLTNVTIITPSNTFKMHRQQLSFFLKKTYLSNKKFKLDQKISFIHWYQAQSKQERLQYNTNVSTYGYYYYHNVVVDTVDVFREKATSGIAISIPATYEFKKNFLIFFEPGITISGWKMNYDDLHLGGGWAVFGNLYFGVRYNFLKRKS